MTGPRTLVRGHIPALDGLRAIAVLMVVLCHTMAFWPGRYGVDVFFVLSGYLITSILANEASAGGIRLGAFYWRRAKRLYPALIVMVALVMLAGPIFREPPTATGALVVLAYLSDYATPYTDLPGEAFGHMWSLAVEEHFYLLWPFAVAGLARVSRGRAAVILLAAFVLATAWRIYVTGSQGWEPAYFRFDTRLSGLILGGLLAYLPALNRQNALLAVAAGLIVLLSWEVSNVHGPIEALTAGVILLAVNGVSMRWLESRPLAYIGKISYGVYLYHWPIAYYCDQEHFAHPVALLVTLAGSLALAAVSFATVERWARSARNPPNVNVASRPVQ